MFLEFRVQICVTAYYIWHRGFNLICIQSYQCLLQLQYTKLWITSPQCVFVCFVRIFAIIYISLNLSLFTLGIYWGPLVYGLWICMDHAVNRLVWHESFSFFLFFLLVFICVKTPCSYLWLTYTIILNVIIFKFCIIWYGINWFLFMVEMLCILLTNTIFGHGLCVALTYL